MPFAILAVIFFAIWLILRALVPGAGKVEGYMEILGFLSIALHLAFGGYVTGWFRRGPPPPAA